MMAAATVLRGGEEFGVEEFAGIGGCVRRREGKVFTEVIVVFVGDLFCIFAARRGGFICLAAGLHRSWHEYIQTYENESKNQKARANELSTLIGIFT